jgi:hypothetical protein
MELKPLEAYWRPPLIGMGDRKLQINITVEIKGSVSNKMNSERKLRMLWQRWGYHDQGILAMGNGLKQEQAGNNELFEMIIPS